MTKSGKIAFERHGAIARIWLDDTASLNALSAPMCEDILSCLDEAAAFDARVIVLSGKGGNFCSGANLAPGQMVEGISADFDAGLLLETHVNPLMERLKSLDIPWISAVEGAAAGVGCSLALAADLIVASEDAYFLQAFRRVGLVPDGGSAFILAQAAGRVRAMEMMLLGEKVPAVKALEWGLVNRVVPRADLTATVEDIATRLATGPTRALALTRKSAWLAVEADFAACLAFERKAQTIAGRSADFAEGLAAFREKRPARFTGT